MPWGPLQQLFHRPTGVFPSHHAACQADVKLLYSLKANVSSVLCAGINAREPVPWLVQSCAAALTPVEPRPAVRKVISKD